MKVSNKNKRFWIIVSLLFVITSGYMLFFPTKPVPAPKVSFKTITNNTVQLKDLQGKAVLVTFWASNCSSCLKEIPHFKSLYQDYHQRGLEIIAIAMYYDRPDYVVETSKAYRIPYDIVLDLDMHLASAFGDVSFTPSTFLVNPEGDIVFRTTGLFDLKAMQQRIESML